ncbi:MAG TPA: hypothetical protein VK168_07315 [Saprospiraceae bacterium]|nr:hypothetical protein [Saprospiraceae bacterium]
MTHPSLEAKTKQELAEQMKISLNTLKRRLKKADLKIPRGHIPPDIQQVIFEKLGWSELSRNGPK